MQRNWKELSAVDKIVLSTSILGTIALIGTAIGTVLVSILKLVYLYRTAKIFREFPVGV